MPNANDVQALQFARDRYADAMEALSRQAKVAMQSGSESRAAIQIAWLQDNHVTHLAPSSEETEFTQ